MADLFKDIIPSILEKKKYILEDEKDYSPFMVNRAVSQHVDCIYFANEMNRFHNLDRRPQYDYYINIVKAHKRPFVKWAKPIKESNLEAVKTYYGYSDAKAAEALKVLNDEQIAFIKKRTTTGE